jgi:hypothetical protein
MTNLHPIMQAALAPFAPKTHSRMSVSASTRPVDGTETFHYCLSDVPLVCEIYWERNERETWDDPGSPDQAMLQSALCGGMEIISLLSEDQVEEIETAFLEQQE